MSRLPPTSFPIAFLALLGIGMLAGGCTRSKPSPRTPLVVLPQPQPPREVLDPRERTPKEEIEPIRRQDVSPITPPEPKVEEPTPPQTLRRETTSQGSSVPTDPPDLAVSREPGEVLRLARETRDLLARTEQEIARLEAAQREHHRTSVALILDLVARSQQALENDDPELAHSLAKKARTLAGDL